MPACRRRDIIWRQGEKRLVVGMSRLDWEQTLAGETAPRRLIAALRFDRVLSCKSRNIDLEAPETALELLGIEFHPGEAPGGSAVLLFAQAARCGSTSNAWNANWPISAPTNSGPATSAKAPSRPDGVRDRHRRHSGACTASNPKSPDSGSGPADHPGMTNHPRKLRVDGDLSPRH